MSFLFRLSRPLLHSLQPEKAHHLALFAVKHRLLPRPEPLNEPSLRVQAFGLHFPNPVGLSAGFDKNAEAIDGLLAAGFGFIETGTVTPLPQAGNPKPRLFRLSEDEAVINRLGFNNGGLEAYVERFRRRNKAAGIAGANIGKNKDQADAVADYVTGLKAIYPFADYVTVNISSPNTQGLRALQQRESLAQLLSALADTRETLARESGLKVPLLLKLAPDLEVKDMEDIAETVLAHGIDGLIVSNTTIARPASLKSVHAGETGGLSGKPLFAPSTDVLKIFYRLVGGKIPLIGVGGIASAEDAYAKIRAGATLVQLYSALVYQGFGLVREIQAGLADRLKRDGFAGVGDAVGIDAR